MIHISEYVILPIGNAGQGAVNEDPLVGQDGARPANTCISPSFQGYVPTQLHGIAIPKSLLYSI
jgi:hypothetical protein